MNGPIYLNAAYWKTAVEGRPVGPHASMLTADQEAYRLTGAYTFPFGLKVGLSWDKFKVKGLAAGTRMPNVFFTGSNTSVVTSGGAVDSVGSVSRNAWMLPILSLIHI